MTRPPAVIRRSPTARATEVAMPGPGDVVEYAGERYELLCEPFLGRTGASVFDDFRLFWRAQIRSLGDPSVVRVGTWWDHAPRRAA